MKSTLKYYSFLLFLGSPCLGYTQQAETPTFEASVLEGCAPFRTVFSCPQQADAYRWDFGNGIVSEEQNPSVVYTEVGVFDVKLRLSYANGAEDSVIHRSYIQSLEQPDAKFTFEVEQAACAGQNEVVFAFSGGENLEYLWDFGDGKISTAAEPRHQFQLAGTYFPTLTLSGAKGCHAAYTAELPVEISGPPSAKFRVDVQETCDAEHAFQFEPEKGNATAYRWTFGDGTTSNLASPGHVYAAYGTFDIELEVTDDIGCTARHAETSFIEIKQATQVDFVTSVDSGCPPLDVSFTASEDFPVLFWKVDGEEKQGNNVSHTLVDPGAYDVELRVVDEAGCETRLVKESAVVVTAAPQTHLNVSKSDFCVKEEVVLDVDAGNGMHDFGDGSLLTTDRSHRYQHAGTYVIRRTVASNENCPGYAEELIQVHGPLLNFVASNRTGCRPFEVGFTASAPVESTVYWYIGEEVYTGHVANHTYTELGTYDVTAIAVDDFGCSDTLSRLAYIEVTNPFLDFSLQDAQSGCAPFTVDFEEIRVGSTFWNLDFGDGEGFSEQVEHTYENAGTYAVALHTAMENGCEITLDTFALVQVEKTEANFDVHVVDCENLEVQVENLSSGALQWEWDFGGSYSDVEHPSHFFEQGGIHSVTLSVVGDFACSDQVTYLDAVDFEQACNAEEMEGDSDDTESSDWTESEDEVNTVYLQQCAPHTFKFKPPPVEVDTWHWELGDGRQTQDSIPLHTYAEPGIYQIKFHYTWNGEQHVLYYKNKIQLLGHPADFTVKRAYTCEGAWMHFQNETAGSSACLWNFGDGTTSTEVNPSHFYPYAEDTRHIHLKTTDTSGCKSSTSMRLHVAQELPKFFMDSIVCFDDTLHVETNLERPKRVVWYANGTVLGEGTRLKHYFGPGHAGKYALTVDVEDSIGCMHAYKVGSIEVVEPVATFSSSKAVYCMTDTVLLHAEQPDAELYYWKLGSTEVMRGQEFQYAGLDSGVHDASLIVALKGCRRTEFKAGFVQVSKPVAEIELIQEDYCPPFEISVRDVSQGTVDRYWDLNQEHAATHQELNLVYQEQLVHPIVLHVTDVHGCSAESQIDSLHLFRANFAPEEHRGCAPFETVFEHAALGEGTFEWQFDGGVVKHGEHVQHVFEHEGNYDVTLIATSHDGCRDTLTRTHHVQVSDVHVDFDIEYEQKCAPQLAVFENKTSGADFYCWNFGDESFAQIEDPVHVYQTGGSYTVKLLASDSLGCVDSMLVSDAVLLLGPRAAFDVSDSILCLHDSMQFVNETGDVVYQQWMFGDGYTSEEEEPHHAYEEPGTYDVTLFVEDDNGCFNLTTQEFGIWVPEPPQFSSSVSDSLGCEPLTVGLNAIFPSDSDAHWDVTGNPSAKRIGDAFELMAGTYEVKFEGVDQYGCTGTQVHHVEVFAQHEAAVHALDPLCEMQEAVILNAVESNGYWYGNGISDYRKGVFDPQAAGPGTHVIHHVIPERCGDRDSILIQVDSKGTTHDFEPLQVCKQDTVLYLETVEQPGNWEGPGIVHSHVAIFDVNRVDPGVHNLCYIQTGACRREDTLQVEVLAPPVVDFEVPQHSYCLPGSLALENTLEADVHYRWQLCSAEDTLTVLGPALNLQPEPGVYDIHFLAQNGFGCRTNAYKPHAFQVFDSVPPSTPEIIRSTVLDDAAVYTEWNVLEGADRVLAFQLYRSENDLPYKYLKTLNYNEKTYTDFDVNVQNKQYTYQIRLLDVCLDQPLSSHPGNSILLQQADNDGQDIYLHWSPYGGWEEGVKTYEIQVLNAQGEWETIREVAGDETEVRLKD